MRLLRTCGLAELVQVASGFATQSLWLRNGKVGSQVISEDQNQLPGRERVGEVRGGKKPATE